MKINLLLGSGIHWENKIPGVETLTEKLLKDYWVRNSDGRYFPYGHDIANLKTGMRADPYQDFLRFLKEKNDEYLQTKRHSLSSNYEDLYNLVELLNKESNGSLDDLPTNRFKREVFDIAFQFRKQISPPDDIVDFSNFTFQTLNFIDNAIRYSLIGFEPTTLNLLVEIAKNPDLIELNIFSLNHDILIEKLFEANDIDYFDGFTETDGEVIWYNHEFKYQTSKIRLFKLHGSINWFFAEKEDHSKSGFAKLTGEDIWFNNDKEGNFVTAIDSKGHFLSGTGKDRSYHFGLFAEIHHAFYNLLKTTNNLIVSGYGWQDQVINGKIYDWISRSSENKIFILHPEPQRFFDKPRISSRTLNKLKKDEILIPVDVGFEAADLDRLQEFI